MIAVRDNPRAAQSYGINLTRTRLAAFAMSGFFAAIAGALFAHLQGVVDPNVFTPQRSLEVFAMAVIGGLTSVGGALAGAMYIVGFEYFLPQYSLLASGLGMLVLLLFFPGGLSELGFTMRDAYLRRLAAKKRIHVPSLVADSRHAFFDNREEEVDLVVSTAEHVEAVVEDEAGEQSDADRDHPADASAGDEGTKDTDDTGEIDVGAAANGSGETKPRRPRRSASKASA
jgi:hypothetical protein